MKELSLCSKSTMEGKSFLLTTLIGTLQVAWVDDGICQHHANTEASGWDDGDCEVLDKEKYPNCTQVPGYKYYATSLGNGYCNGNLNTKECGYDGGGCNEFNALFPRCVVGGITKIGDGICHGKPYNSKECDFDGGDCLQFNENIRIAM